MEGQGPATVTFQPSPQSKEGHDVRVPQLTEHTALCAELHKAPLPLHALHVQALEGHQGGGVLSSVHPAARRRRMGSVPAGVTVGRQDKVMAGAVAWQ